MSGLVDLKKTLCLSFHQGSHRNTWGSSFEPCVGGKIQIFQFLFCTNSCTVLFQPAGDDICDGTFSCKMKNPSSAPFSTVAHMPEDGLAKSHKCSDHLETVCEIFVICYFEQVCYVLLILAGESFRKSVNMYRLKIYGVLLILKVFYL